MTLRRCLDGPEMASPGSSRCIPHQRIKDQQRGTTTARGYGHQHQAIRAQLLDTYQPNDPCRRCHQSLGPDPTRLDLGHPTDGFTTYALEHAACNRGRRRTPP